MSKDTRTELLQLRNHLNNLIMVSGVTEERLSQLRVIERLLGQMEKDEEDMFDEADDNAGQTPCDAKDEGAA